MALRPAHVDKRHALRRHADAAYPAVTSVEVVVGRPSAAALLLAYTVSGDIADLALPPVAAPARTAELWRHTCFEAFIGMPGGTYYEFNFAPSTQWAAYRFSGYRKGMRTATEITAPQLAVDASAGCFMLRATLDLGAAVSAAGGAVRAAWRLGLSAVIEERSGRQSHWALAHPPGKPDFHHADGFALDWPDTGRP